MKKQKHILYYFCLFSVLATGLFLILAFTPNRNLQMITLVGISISYVLLGIVHHLINHDLVAKIVVEYILIAALGVAGAFFIFKGGFGF